MLDYPFSDASTSCYRGGTPVPPTVHPIPFAQTHGEIQPHRVTWIPRYSMPLSRVLQYLHGFHTNSGDSLSRTIRIRSRANDHAASYCPSFSRYVLFVSSREKRLRIGPSSPGTPTERLNKKPSRKELRDFFYLRRCLPRPVEPACFRGHFKSPRACISSRR